MATDAILQLLRIGRTSNIRSRGQHNDLPRLPLPGRGPAFAPRTSLSSGDANFAAHPLEHVLEAGVLEIGADAAAYKRAIGRPSSLPPFGHLF